MRRFRFSIAAMLVVVLFVAVAVAALRQADALWDSALFSLALGLLALAVLVAVHRPGGRRAYWLGFALVGGAYLGASLVPPIEARLLTTRALVALDARMPGRDDLISSSVWTIGPGNRANALASVAFSPNGRILASGSQGSVRIWDVTTGKPIGGPGGTSEHFLRVGHTLVALLLAYLGGHFSRWLQSRRPDQEVQGQAPAASGT
ncbi:WD40 domain-containing protein [Tautonia plasticadhaerens]|uniref:Uncharacterized protein n=1 Tax=Tautonia plasticadhaerens TaxID=2527974 RepID=A0A518H9P5_9BACT|nr:hypothetical protein [Tautonia plasticadhaerens]QDV37582.1 hypothetical protein ElP_55220 [Tautonia plasticadhaerens]